jgi:hypothetical protein
MRLAKSECPVQALWNGLGQVPDPLERLSLIPPTSEADLDRPRG